MSKMPAFLKGIWSDVKAMWPVFAAVWLLTWIFASFNAAVETVDPSPEIVDPILGPHELVLPTIVEEECPLRAAWCGQ